MSFSSVATNIRNDDVLDRKARQSNLQLESLKNMWGELPKSTLEGFDPRNFEAIDVLRLYFGRALRIPRDIVSARLINSQNGHWLKDVFPWIESDEINWIAEFEEANLAIFPIVAEG